jgi:hypothetical protein
MLVLYWYNPISKNQLKIQYVFEIERNKKIHFHEKYAFCIVVRILRDLH